MPARASYERRPATPSTGRGGAVAVRRLLLRPPRGERGATTSAGALIDAREVPFHGARADVELDGDRVIGRARRHQAAHRAFRFREAAALNRDAGATGDRPAGRAHPCGDLRT